MTDEQANRIAARILKADERDGIITLYRRTALGPAWKPVCTGSTEAEIEAGSVSLMTELGTQLAGMELIRGGRAA